MRYCEKHSTGGSNPTYIVKPEDCDMCRWVSRAKKAEGCLRNVKSIESKLRAFITGSRRYGKPRADSDLDLVIMTDPEAHQKLCQHGDVEDGSRYCQIRYGRLNIVVVNDQEKFLVWRSITEKLAEQAPVTRDHAKATMKAALGESTGGDA